MDGMAFSLCLETLIVVDVVNVVDVVDVSRLYLSSVSQWLYRVPLLAGMNELIQTTISL